jgi:CRISPR-associated protein Csb3
MNVQSGSMMRVRVDPGNPGQFFACCGLLELAERVGGAEGWFERSGKTFCVQAINRSAEFTALTVLQSVASCQLTNTMTANEVMRRGELPLLRKRATGAQAAQIEELAAEQTVLDTLWRESPVLLPEPLNLRIDWFVDKRGGGSTFKTWAGQQSVLDIARGLQTTLTGDIVTAPPEDCLLAAAGSDCRTFNFDSDFASLGSDLDLGFSLDPLRSSRATSVEVRPRPAIELLAFIGLQRFRAMEIGGDQPRRQRRYRFALWFVPMPPALAAVVASSAVDWPDSQLFEFRLLYRSDYLKSFLPATPL